MSLFGGLYLFVLFFSTAIALGNWNRIEDSLVGSLIWIGGVGLGTFVFHVGMDRLEQRRVQPGTVEPQES